MRFTSSFSVETGSLNVSLFDYDTNKQIVLWTSLSQEYLGSYDWNPAQLFLNSSSFINRIGLIFLAVNGNTDDINLRSISVSETPFNSSSGELVLSSITAGSISIYHKRFEVDDISYITTYSVYVSNNFQEHLYYQGKMLNFCNETLVK